MSDKVMGIGIVCQLTGLTERQIRYYEARQLITPERTEGRTRKYSFEDVETLKEIHSKLTHGFSTHEIRQLDAQRRKKMKL